YPAWAIENWHVYPDPRARFGDPSDPDHPPMPPDDPAAYDLSPNPQKPCKAGIARIEGKGYLELLGQWDRENRERLAKEEEEEKRKEEGQQRREPEASLTRSADGMVTLRLRPRLKGEIQQVVALSQSQSQPAGGTSKTPAGPDAATEAGAEDAAVQANARSS